ncbi:CBS domain-containing protein [Candidatus Woesearchaeota archaeon]|nr:MAG: CBS domain-containing protein [Candidatus Woesearchaeota archaeon]
MALFGFRRRRLLKKAKSSVQRLLSLPAEAFMTDFVVTIKPEKTVLDAAMLMIGEDISTLVVEEDEKPVGVLTERDFITKVRAADAKKLAVRDVMTKHVVSVSPKETAQAMIHLLKEHHIRKLVVVHEDGTIAGIVTQTDLGRVLHKEVRIICESVPPIFVRNVMTKHIITVDESQKLHTAKQIMAKKAISSLPVKKGDAFVGIFTEYDLVSRFYGAEEAVPNTIPEIMKSPVKAIPGDLTIFDANLIMLFENCRRLLVIEEERVVGIVTQTDIVHAAFAYLERMHEYLETHGDIVTEESFTLLKDSTHIISEYAGEHLRLFTLKTV